MEDMEEDCKQEPLEHAEANGCSNTAELEIAGKEAPEESSDERKLYYCGAGSCKPRWLQVFATKKWFTAFLCTFALTETALISGFQPVVISSLERRYRFSSLAASLIVSAFDIAGVFGAPIVSYFGEKRNKPRILGIAFVMQGIGSLLFALPHFLFGNYVVGSDAQIQFESCNDTVEPLSNCDAGNSAAYAILVIANALMGIGVAPLFTLGFSYLDDIVHPKYISLHVGAFQISTIIGPAIGFGLGSAFISVYVDPGVPTPLTESDPGWVGGWWLCFVVAGIVSLIGSIPFFFYPRLLHDSHLVKEERLKQMTRNYKGKFGKEETFIQQLKAFPYHLVGLFKSKSWFFMTVGVTVLFLGLDGLVSFAPKYLETVYQVPSSTAGLLIGAMAIIAGAGGAFVGALLVYCIKVGKNMTIILWVVSLIAIIPLHGFFFICPNPTVAGVNTLYYNNSIPNLNPDNNDVLLASCNVDCNCSSTIYEPVCGADDITYFSPCRASCLKIVTDNPTPGFIDCGCVNDSVPVGNRTAEPGVCPQDCNLLAGFVVSVTVFVFFIFMIEVPTLLTQIRTVADEQRSLALGVASVIFRVFGSIPGPILFGAIVDSGCTYWQVECGRRANCWVYDNYKLSTRAYAFCLACVIICGISTFLVWIFYPPVNTCCSPDSELAKDDSKNQSESEHGFSNETFKKIE